MADWGLYSALSGVDNWAEKRQEMGMQLLRATTFSDMEKQKGSEQMASAQMVAEYMKEIGKLKVLDRGHERVNAIDDELKKPIREGLMKSGGDVKKFMASGGFNELNKYVEKLHTHPVVQRELMNALNYNQWSADRQAGLIPRKVFYSSDGSHSMGDPTEAFQAYVDGKTDSFNYNGGYKRPNYDAETHFASIHGKDRYKREAIHPEALFRYILEVSKKEGLSTGDAMEFASGEVQYYEKSLLAGANPFTYKWDDPSVRDLRYAQMAHMRAGDAANAPASDWLYAFRQTNPTVPGRVFIPQDNLDQKPVTDPNTGLTTYYYSLGNDLNNILHNVFGYGVQKGKVSNVSTAITRNSFKVGKDAIDLSGVAPENIEAIEPTGRAVKQVDPTTGQMVDGMEYKITLKEPGIETAKYKGKYISQGLSDQQIPMAKNIDEPGFRWFGMGNDYKLQMSVWEPMPDPANPQQYEEYRRQAQRNSTGAMRGTSLSFDFGSSFQDDLQEGDAVIYNQ